MTRDDLRSDLDRELTDLEAGEQPRLLALLGGSDAGDGADRADRANLELDLFQVHVRIERLRDRLAALDRVEAAGDDAGWGVTVVLDFGDGPEAYLLGEFSFDGRQTITPGSPLGRALVGAAPGEKVTYPAPRGQSTVTVVGYADGRSESSAA